MTMVHIDYSIKFLFINKHPKVMKYLSELTNRKEQK